MAKLSKEDKRLKKEAAKQKKKEKKEKKGRVAKVAAQEERSLLIPILTALLVLVGIFNLCMIGVIGWSILGSGKPAALPNQPSSSISESMPPASN
ncbi:MAG: hypothetical protein HFF18_10810 [Oscillospiraceae bacterium]|nr:hypothetical protein [Oscillospiraceae bacterium]